MTKFKIFLKCAKCGTIFSEEISYYREAPPSDEEIKNSSRPCPTCGESDKNARQVGSINEYDPNFENYTAEMYQEVFKDMV